MRRGRSASTTRVLALELAVALAVALAMLTVAAVRHMGSLLVVSDSPATADVVLITYGVNSFARPAARASALTAAASRYTRGEAQTVLLSELHDSSSDFSTHVDLARQALMKAGVQDGDIVVLPVVESEREEALAVRDVMERNGWTRVVAYAPDFRSRRTRGALLRATTGVSGVDVRVVSVRNWTTTLDQWWRSRQTVSAVLNEYPRLIYYLARGWA